MSTARLVDIIIALVVLEMIALCTYRVVKHRGMRVSEVISFLGAGIGLMLALRVLISGGRFALFATAMLAAGIFHVWHVKQRWT